MLTLGWYTDMHVNTQKKRDEKDTQKRRTVTHMGHTEAQGCQVRFANTQGHTLA